MIHCLGIWLMALVLYSGFHSDNYFLSPVEVYSGFGAFFGGGWAPPHATGSMVCSMGVGWALPHRLFVPD
jgi:hypothetical protein